MRNKLATLGALLVLIAALVGGAYAGCSSCGGGGAEWTAGRAFLDDTPEITVVTPVSQPNKTNSSEEDQNPTISPDDLLQDREKYVLAYVSDETSDSYIQGAIALPWSNFLNEDGTLKSMDELAQILSDAGISETDSLVLYSDYDSYNDTVVVYWIMSYLGHQDVRLLEMEPIDGSLTLPMQNAPSTRTPASYTASLNPDILEKLAEHSIFSEPSPTNSP